MPADVSSGAEKILEQAFRYLWYLSELISLLLSPHSLSLLKGIKRVKSRMLVVTDRSAGGLKMILMCYGFTVQASFLLKSKQN